MQTCGETNGQSHAGLFGCDLRTPNGTGVEELISTNYHSPGGGRLDLNKEATRRGDAGMPRPMPQHISLFTSSLTLCLCLPQVEPRCKARAHKCTKRIPSISPPKDRVYHYRLLALRRVVSLRVVSALSSVFAVCLTICLAIRTVPSVPRRACRALSVSCFEHAVLWC